MKKLGAARVYFITTWGFGLYTSIIFTLNMVYQVRTVGLNPLQLVLVGTALEVTILMFEIPTGVVADLNSRRLSTIIGFALMGLGFVVEGSWPLFATVLLAQVIWGLGWTFISGAHAAWIADEVGQEAVASIYLRGTQYRQIGALLGIPLSVLLGSYRLNLPLLVGGSLSIVLALFLALWMPEQNFRPAMPEARQSWAGMIGTFRQGAQLVKQRPVLITFLAIGVFIGLSSEGYDRLWTAHILENLSFPTIGHLNDETWFGIMRAGSMVLTLAATEVVRRKVQDQPPNRTVSLLQMIHGIMIIALLALALADHIGLAIAAFWVFGTMRNVSDPLSTAWANQYINSEVRATVLSMSGQVDAVGQIVGGPIVGVIGTVRSLRAALVSSAIILAPVVPLYGRARRQHGLPEPEPAATDD